MKKVFGFFRSMRFGMLLLLLIALLSILGTVITQGEAAEYYTTAYGSMGGVITALGLDHLYTTPYYAGLFGLLCVNLLLCSVLRAGKLRGRTAKLVAGCEQTSQVVALPAPEQERWLSAKGFRPCGKGFVRHRAGMAGSFITHIGLLLLLVAAALSFMLQEQTDHSIPVGDTVLLEDGTQLRVDAFTIQDEAGRVDYAADVTVTSADGQQTITGTARVNQPVHAFGCTIYQQSYAYAGVVDIHTAENPQDERVTLETSAFISLDGVNGVSYMGGYGSFIVGADGSISQQSDGKEGTPVIAYPVGIIDSESQSLHLAKVDESFELAGVTYTFRAPAYYPGLRVKTLPGWVLPLLYTSFGLILLGLYLCFFHYPIAAVRQGDSIRLHSMKDISGWLDAVRAEAHT